MRIVADSEAAYKQGSQFIDANRDMHTHKKTDHRVVSLFFYTQAFKVPNARALLGTPLPID